MSTGIARIDTDSLDVTLQTLSVIEVIGLVQDSEFKADKIILEKIPASSMFELLLLYNNLIFECRRLNIEYVSIAPSQWKPLRNGRNWKCALASTPHEQDAYNLLRYHLLFNLNKDIGDL